MLKAARRFRPDVVVVLGDYVDFNAVSSHPKDLRRTRFVAEELEDAATGLDELDGLGAHARIYIGGNHDRRLAVYIAARAPELFGIHTVEGALELKRRGWQYVPYGEAFKLGQLRITHDIGYTGKYALHQSQADFGTSLVIGHSHRLALIGVGTAEGETLIAASFGWLGDATKIDYLHSTKVSRDWMHGFGLGYIHRDGTVDIVPVPIRNGRCVIEGRVIR